MFMFKVKNFNLKIYQIETATKVEMKSGEKHITEERKGMEM